MDSCLLVLLSWFLFIQSGSRAACHQSVGSRIISGAQANMNQFPYLVHLEITWVKPGNTDKVGDGNCGGILIDMQTVVTAAHCLHLEEMALAAASKIVAGSHLKGTGSQVREFSVEDICIHHKFKQHMDVTTPDFDLAVIQVQIPFILAYNVQPIMVMITPPRPGTNCSIAGWGRTEPNNVTGSHFLRFAVMTIATSCEKPHPSKICARAATGGACRGDSGGPLVCFGQLAGVISGGAASCPLNQAMAFTNVAQIRNWLFNRSRKCRALTDANWLHQIILLLNGM